MLGRTLDTLPNEIHKGVEYKKKNKSAVDNWKERMEISNKFWNAWKKEYLANIRKFSKQNNIEKNTKNHKTNLRWLGIWPHLEAQDI